MFSRRTAWALEPAAPLAADLDLTLSNPTAAGFTYPDDLYRALADERSAVYDPLPFGLASAREAVAAYYAARLGAPVDPARVGLCASTSEAYSHLLALLCDPGDVVLVPRPGYPLLDLLAEIGDTRLVHYPLLYDGAWSLDLAALERLLAATPDVRALVVVAPNNPTGNYLRPHELAALQRLLAPRDIALLVDEVFWDYPLAPGPRPTSLTGPHDALTFTLSGLSKVAALPQLKLSWWLAHGPDALVHAALARLELIADTFLSVATPVQHALPRLLAAAPGMQAQISRRTLRNLESLRAASSASAFSVLDVDAGWLALLRLPAVHDLDGAAWAALLLRRGLHVQSGHLYGLHGPHVAVSLLTPEPVLHAGLQRLHAALRDLL
ncbi:MAG: pyridoxal phosphate-dependent aminotransferase [Myxococcales bacterium]|nr:pyridoxal phosphate-dependent aminotransferase [Myxococcales bacterium]